MRRQCFPVPLAGMELAGAAFPSPGGSEVLEAQVLGHGVSVIRPLISVADAGHYSAAESDGWGPGHVCGLLSTPAPPTGEVGPLQRVCPHTPQRQVFRKLPTQPCQNCPHAMRQAHTHAGLPCPPVSPPPRAAGTAAGGPAGGEGVCRPRLPRNPGAPCFSRLCVPGCRCLGRSLSRGRAGSGFTENLEGQSLAVLCWMPGPRESCG